MKMNAAWAAVIGAFFGMIGTIATAWFSRDPPPPAEEVSAAAPAATPGDGSTAPGTWSGGTYRPNVAYQAVQNGFVAAYSGTSKPAKNTILRSGPAPDQLSARTRLGEFEGSVMPVTKGQWWMVDREGSGTVTVQWFTAWEN
jgi:hypothetical protein